MQSLLICLVAFQSPKTVIPPQALFSTAVSGLERTGARREVIGPALRVTIGQISSETNATQLSIPNGVGISQGDVLLAKFKIRGKTASGWAGRVEFYFEKATSPWTKSVIQAISTRPVDWKEVEIPFKSIASFKPGEAMASIRLAFGPQTIEIKDFSVVNFHNSKDLADLQREARDKNRLGNVTVNLDASRLKQRMIGLGGNFTKPRYGSNVPLDAVADAVLAGLPVRIARTGLPLNHFAPTPSTIVDGQGPALASFQALQRLAKLKVPIVSSVWEGAEWLLPGRKEQGGKVLPEGNYGVCADLVVRYLKIARDKFGVIVDYFSFNEPDLGINFKFTGAQMAKFIGVLGPKLREANLPTKVIIGDTASGRPSARYSTEILSDNSIAPYLGPIGFHCWDALSASDADYRSIAFVGKRFKKEIWCLEAGHDAQLWQASNPWPTWQNAIRTAQAYLKTISLTGCSTMAYWTYEDDYPIASKDGKTKFSVFAVLGEMSKAFDRGTTIVETSSSTEDFQAVGAKSGSGIVVVGVNPIGAGKVTLSGLPRSKTAALYIQTESGIQRSQVRTGSSGRIELSIPPSTFITLSVK